MRRLVLLVSVVVLVDTTFYSVVAPLLPTYVDELGLSKAAAGILTAAYPAGTLLFALPCGALAAVVGPKRTLMLGVGLLGVSSLAFGFAQDIVLLDLARFVQGIGGACSWAGGLAWLVAEAPPERRGQLIGTALGAGIAGALFGPVVGSVAAATSPQLVFGSVVVVAAGLIAWAIGTPSTHVTERQGVGAVAVALRRPDVSRAVWLVALPSLAFGVLNVIGPLRLDGFGASSLLIAAIFLVAAGVEASISPWVGRVSDRSGPMVPIRVGLVAAAVVLALFCLPQAAWLLGLTILALACALGTFWAPAMAMLSDAAERGGLHQGYAFALVNLAWAGGQVAGSGVGGAIADASADVVPLTIAATACTVTYLVVRRKGGEVLGV